MLRNVTCVKESVVEVLCNGTVFTIEETKLTPSTSLFWVYLCFYVVLVLIAGLMSGLTVGLLSLDISQLEILVKAGKPDDQKHAAKILPVVKRHHLLLVSLLLTNAAAMETMPIFMDKISNPITAILVSVSAVLIFGEIIPMALCSRYSLAIGSYLSPVVKVLMIVLFIIAWPIAKLLDWLVGNSHGTFFRRAELKELVEHHRQPHAHNEEPLTIDEALIIKGALDLKNKTAIDAFVDLQSVFMLESSVKLDMETRKRILRAGHSRIPVYEGTRDNIVGLLLVKTILALSPEEATPLTAIMRSRKYLPKVFSDEPLYNLLNTFQTGKSHMCLVARVVNYGDNEVHEEIIGIITLEDVFEELLQEEIVDETDVYVDVAKRIRVARLKLHQRSNQYTASGQDMMSGNSIARMDRSLDFGGLMHYGTRSCFVESTPLLKK